MSGSQSFVRVDRRADDGAHAASVRELTRNDVPGLSGNGLAGATQGI
jgi:hypothetical protein